MNSNRPGLADGPWLANGGIEQAALLSCLIILILKFLLVWRLNVNWDEFFFLSHVHDLERGNLTLVLQALHTHLFRWLVDVGGDEMREIASGRLVMTCLLGATILLIWKLASGWASGHSAALAALTYVAMASTVKHGGSFRADSLLTPLTVLSLLLFVHRQGGSRREIAAGAVLGLATAVTIKAALVAPVFIALAFLDGPTRDLPRFRRIRSSIERLCRLALSAAAVTAILTGAHWLALSSTPKVTAGEFAVRSAQTTLIDVELFPQAGFFKESIASDALAWTLIAAGIALAIVRKRGQVLAFALTLLPILVYRNSFPYYYPVMLAPACVLSAIAFDSLGHWVHCRLGEAARNRIMGATVGLLLFVGIIHVAQLWRDDQQAQREVIAAVHQIFTEPVPYVDHSGMISSFPKVNFFMSGWGLQGYRQKGVAFMPKALETRRPAFVLSNRPVLEPGYPAFQLLLPEDRELIELMYIPYWGPIRVAGARAVIPEGGSVEVRLPFAGSYRLVSAEPILVAGKIHEPEEVIEVTGRTVELSRTAGLPGDRALEVRLVLAAAHAPPSAAPPTSELYTGL